MQTIKLVARKFGIAEENLVRRIADFDGQAAPYAFAVSGPCAFMTRDEAPAEALKTLFSEKFKALDPAAPAEELLEDGCCALAADGFLCLGAKRVTRESQTREFERLRAACARASAEGPAALYIAEAEIKTPEAAEALPAEAAPEESEVPAEADEDKTAFPEDAADETQPAQKESEAPAKPASRRHAASKKKPGFFAAQTEQAGPKESAPAETRRAYAAGDSLAHPLWGEGVVGEVVGDIYMVEFKSVGKKRLSAAWVARNID